MREFDPAVGLKHVRVEITFDGGEIGTEARELEPELWGDTQIMSKNSDSKIEIMGIYLNPFQERLNVQTRTFWNDVFCRPNELRNLG
jgi:hypothetical protein